MVLFYKLNLFPCLRTFIFLYTLINFLGWSIVFVTAFSFVYFKLWKSGLIMVPCLWWIVLAKCTRYLLKSSSCILGYACISMHFQPFQFNSNHWNQNMANKSPPLKFKIVDILKYIYILKRLTAQLIFSPGWDDINFYRGILFSIKLSGIQVMPMSGHF